MITANDFIHLPFTPDLTEGGIAYAIRSLPYTYDRMGGSSFDRLRRIVAGVAVELAFRRYLSEQGIPFDVKGATPFTDPDRYDVSLGGHRCGIKSFLITHREQISEMRRDPNVVLKAPALVPSDQHSADGHSYHDLYLFAFLSGLIAASLEDLKKALDANRPVYLIHTLPDAWTKPITWCPIGPLALKSESDGTLTVELSGQDEGRDFLTRTIELPPHIRVVVDDPFFALSCIHTHKLPNARVGIYSTARKETHLIGWHEWGNLWVYGMDILLTGYLSREEFRRRASFIQPGSRVFQYNQTRTKNLAVPVKDLQPLSELFERVRE
ncbi:MAG TPA: hypothetical protein VMT73_09470 [Anaerolineales bacterium]|nr:hypothetical protein [Anaerolineales bacterium]